MKLVSVQLALALLVRAFGSGAAAQVKAHGNPIRKVVKMLQMMEKKSKEQEEKQEKLFDNYQCYCKETQLGLDKSISRARDRLPQLDSSLKEARAMHQQLTEDVKQHQKDRAEAEETMNTAVALRDKEAQAHNKESVEFNANINALGKAIEAVQKGMSGAAAFVQTDDAAVLRTLASSERLEPEDREELTSFLTTKASSEGDAAYEPDSGEILGVLKQIRVHMTEELAELDKAELASKASQESIVHAKRKEIALATKAIEAKMLRGSDVAVDVTSLEDDLGDTQQGQDEDTKFLGELKVACQNSKEKWAAYKKMLGQELMALADTIKLLNDDDALDLFKKTLPSPQAMSFLQVSTGRKSKAMATLHRLKRKDRRVAFLVMALRGKKEGFAEVKKMIDRLVVQLKDEQVNDDNKKEHCESEIDRLEDDVKSGKREIADLDTGAAEATDSLKDVNEQMEGLQTGIAELDAQVAAATSNRKKEKDEALEALAENQAAKQLLELAKNRLFKFYNPKLHKEEAKPVRSEQDQIADSFNAAAALTEVSEAAPPPSPKQAPQLDYSKRQQEAGGVLGMLDLLRNDIAQQTTVIEVDEKHAQQEYEHFIKESSSKRALDAKAIVDKDDEASELKVRLHQFKMNKKVKTESLASVKKERALTHKDCDWLLQKYQLRKEARTDEIDALNKAHTVLSGAETPSQ